MIEINNTSGAKIDLRSVKKTADNFLRYYGHEKKTVSIAFVSDGKIKEINKKYRGRDKITDVLSFPEEGDDLGEIIIDYNQIKRQALKYSADIKEELIFILIHGLLHLSGYDDDTEKGRKEMEKLGKEFIKTLNYKF